jgi:GT2 family glycosyltransferase/glycosyltransferase involved in cell wall biosynthesis
MRVLHVVHGFPPAASGGTEVYVRNLTRALSSAGDQVFVLTRTGDFARPEHSVTRDADRAVSVVRINNTFQSCASFEESYSNPALLRTAVREIEEIAPDVVHVQHLTCLSTGLLQAIASLRIPIVMTLNDYWMICHRGQLFNLDGRRCPGPFDEGCDKCLPAGALAAPLAFRAGRIARASPVPGLAAVAHHAIKLVEAVTPRARTRDATLTRLGHMQAASRHVDLFLAPSATLEALFLQFGIARERLRRCEQGIDVALFEGRPGAAAGMLRVGYAGGIIPSKAPHLLLQAAARFRPGAISVDIIGQGTPFHGDGNYARRIAPLLSQPFIRRVGPVPPERMPDALAAIDVLVVPSVWIENAPFIIREAFAARVPVIAANLGGMAEMVRHEVDGLLFEPGDSASLAAAIERLVRVPDLLHRLRAGIRRPFSIQEDAAQLQRIYRGLARRSASISAPRRDTPVARASVHAVVLNYRTPDQTWVAVKSLQSSFTSPERVLIVDSGSQDGSAEWLRGALPDLHVIETGTNLGFPGGCNVGLRRVIESDAEFALLANSDVVLRPDALDALLAAARRNADAGVLAPVLLSREEPDRIASAGMSYSKVSGRMKHAAAGRPLALLDPPGTHDVDAVSGCVMLIRTDALRRAGLFDEDYFFSFEDLEFCLRVRRTGYRILCVPDAIAYHEGGRSIGRRSPRRVYYATRNHLLVAAQTAGGGPIARASRAGFIVGLNAAYALTSRDVPLLGGLAAVTRGAWHHVRGRYGAG